MTLNAGQARMAAQMPERALQGSVEAMAKDLGLLYYHTYRSDRSPAGFPDCVFVGPHGVAYRELKASSGKVSPKQRQWIDGLVAAGQDAEVWRPVDLLDGTVAALLLKLSRGR